jgi:hypothetical protein
VAARAVHCTRHRRRQQQGLSATRNISQQRKLSTGSGSGSCRLQEATDGGISCPPAAVVIAVDCRRSSAVAEAVNCKRRRSWAHLRPLASLHGGGWVRHVRVRTGRVERGWGAGSSAERDPSYSWAWVGPRHLSARRTHSLSRVNQWEEAPHCNCRADSASARFPHCKPAGAQAGRKDLRSQHSWGRSIGVELHKWGDAPWVLGWSPAPTKEDGLAGPRAF